MEIIVLSAAAFAVALLTFFTGFGLGTILTPVFMIFFPVELAIALTGVVHLFNNGFKLVLTGRHADRQVLIRFGIPAVIAALLGSWLLLHIPDASPLFTYNAFGHRFEVYPIKLMVSAILILLALMDLIPFFSTLQFSKNKLPVGGALSGFFGGLSGNQGALRSAFLIKAGLTREAFIATTVVVSTFVDLTRLSVYSTQFIHAGLTEQLNLVFCATLAGIAGSYIGNRLLKKVSLKSLKVAVAIMLILISLGLGSGLL